MKVVIVGAGLGGIACGIACRRQGLDVTILERAPELSEASVFEKIKCKATEILVRHLRRWDNGDVLATRKYGPISYEKYGYPAMVIHRADLQQALIETAAELGVEIKTGCDVMKADFEATEVILTDGQRFKADVIVGADGIWSTLRSQVVGKAIEPAETGDLAYRGTFTRQQLEELDDAEVIRFCDENKQTLTLWLGPLKHAVFYAIRGGELWNLVLLTPDRMKKGQRTEKGDLAEMCREFENWDPILTKITTCFSSTLKWKLCHHSELETWVNLKHKSVLLGDSAHPTLPYQSQGAAMAFGDAAVLGALLGRFSKTSTEKLEASGMTLPKVLGIFESLQKPYSTLNVKGAATNRIMYHLPDGEEQQRRDREFSGMTGESESKWTWIDGRYQKHIIGTDLVKMALDKFDLEVNADAQG
ncbi:3-hydroxybenzoate 6-hydroxylase 1 [Fusarium tjaetaba]|uniref:3-hydroxybenzoate 6-hydroxylase 1 n=1 Tax=Fusarium tjaetaba TaxID=1567544 RepID=A0A8H5RLH0_9HYPO|nr:3-hydroxybenzoate 6-hydroxylase 1 [Fusarium tjaetaba]KAF5636971.1 3-hydroxybenzoate 6-hydroxylase 1 [Fusarium tjaetaba]